jgi:hypothetical protein
MISKSFRFATPRLTLWLGLLASGALACSSDSKGEPQATETNVNTPSMLADTGPVQFATTGNDDTVCQTALFCDGFEAATADAPPAAPWSPVQTNGSVIVDATHPFRGGKAVKATTLSTAASGQTYKRALIGLASAPVIPVPNNAFYGRMMFYLESAPQASLHWTFIDATGPIPGQDYTSTYRYGGQFPLVEDGAFKGSQLMANYDTNDFYGTPSRGPNTDCSQQSDKQVVPVGKWSCAEWYFDGQSNQMKIWLDGTAVTSAEVDGKGMGCTGVDAKAVPDYPWTAPTFSRIDMGWESYATDDERTIWIDDVVISSTKVGCPDKVMPASSSNSNPGRTGY